MDSTFLRSSPATSQVIREALEARRVAPVTVTYGSEAIRSIAWEAQ